MTGETDTVIPLLTVDDAGQFTIHKPAADFLSTQGPIGVVAAVGKYRTGKSCLLNQLLLQAGATADQGFPVGESVQACTKGLLLNTVPIVDTDGYKLFVVDTEGIGALDANNTHDVRIFSLALLLSSSLLYNSTGAIDESTIQTLSLVTQVCNEIHTSKTDTTVPSFPHFTWVLRDFSLQLVDESGGTITANEYMEHAFGSGEQNAQALQEGRCEIREAIRKLFPNRSCCPLPAPAKGDLTMRDQGRYARPSPFARGVKRLYKNIVERVKPLRAGDANVTGPMYIELMKYFAGCVCDPTKCPNVRDSWTLLVDANAAAAKTAGVEHFRRQMHDAKLSGKPHASHAQLLDWIEQSVRVATEALMTSASAHVRDQLVATLRAELDELKRSCVEQQQAQAEHEVVGFWQELSDKHAREGHACLSTISAATREWEAAHECDVQLQLRAQFRAEGCNRLLSWLTVLVAKDEERQREHANALDDSERRCATLQAHINSLDQELERLRAEQLQTPTSQLSATEDVPASGDAGGGGSLSELESVGASFDPSQYVDIQTYDQLLSKHNELVRKNEMSEASLLECRSKCEHLEATGEAKSAEAAEHRERMEGALNQLRGRLQTERAATKSADARASEQQAILGVANETIRTLKDSLQKLSDESSNRWARIHADFAEDLAHNRSQLLSSQQKSHSEQLELAKQCMESKQKEAFLREEQQRLKRALETSENEVKRLRMDSSDRASESVRAGAQAQHLSSQLQRAQLDIREANALAMNQARRVGMLESRLIAIGESIDA